MVISGKNGLCSFPLPKLVPVKGLHFWTCCAHSLGSVLYSWHVKWDRQRTTLCQATLPPKLSSGHPLPTFGPWLAVALWRL